MAINNSTIYRSDEIEFALENNAFPALLFEREPDNELNRIPGTDGYRISKSGNTVKDKNGNYVDIHYDSNNSKMVNVTDTRGNRKTIRVATAVARTYVDGYSSEKNIAIMKRSKHDTNYTSLYWGSQSSLNKRVNECGKNLPPQKEDIKRYLIIDPSGENVGEVTGLGRLAYAIRYDKSNKCLSKSIKDGTATIQDNNSKFNGCKIIIGN